MQSSNFNLKGPWVPVAAFVLLLACLLAVNTLAGLAPVRLDATEEDLYTLSDGSERIVNKLEYPVTLKYYFSASVGEVPVRYKNYARKVRELLEQYDTVGGGMVTLEEYDPRPDSDEEAWAQRYGLNGASLPNGERLFFGLVVTSEDREAVVPFFDPRREQHLEYDISEAISQVRANSKEQLAVLSWLPIAGGRSQQGRTQPWVALDELRKNFDVQMLQPAELVEVPEEVQLLMVVQPKQVTPQQAYAIDQFLLRGGKLMVFIDPHARMDQGPGGMMSVPEPGDLGPLLDHWGIDYELEKVVADQALATRVNAPEAGPLDYPVWLTLDSEHLNQEQVITSELEEITLIDSGAFAPQEGFQHEFTPLMTSSQRSGMMDLLDIRFSMPLEVAKNAKPDGQSRVLSALVSGQFTTAFPDGFPEPAEDSEQQQQRPRQQQESDQPEQPTQPHLSEAQEETTILLVGDSDFFADQFSVRESSFFGNRMVQPINDNLNFVLNSAEFMMGSQDLIHVRSRGQFSRPFTLVQDLQVQAAQQYQAREQQLSERLNEVRSRLEELEAQRQEGQEVIYSQEQLEEIRRFRQEEQDTRAELREVRKVLRQDIERLGNALLATNLMVMPGIVAIVGFITIYRRSKRRGGKR